MLEIEKSGYTSPTHRSEGGESVMADVLEREASTRLARGNARARSDNRFRTDVSPPCIYSTPRIATGAAITAAAPIVVIADSGLLGVVTAVLMFAGVIFADTLI
jgi:hypothetical protein